MTSVWGWTVSGTAYGAILTRSIRALWTVSERKALLLELSAAGTRVVLEEEPSGREQQCRDTDGDQP